MRPIVNVPEENRATQIGNVHKKLSKDRACDSGDILADRQTDRHTDRHTYVRAVGTLQHVTQCEKRRSERSVGTSGLIAFQNAATVGQLGSWTHSCSLGRVIQASWSISRVTGDRADEIASPSDLWVCPSLSLQPAPTTFSSYRWLGQQF